MVRVLIWSSVAFFLAGCGSNRAPAPDAHHSISLEERISAIAQPLIRDNWAKGIVIGVLQEGEERYFAYGSVGDTAATPPDENTVFEIGSITKVFTSIALADMAAKGEVALDDPVESCLPEGMKISTSGGRPITLESLAAHTSGLPLIPANFWQEGDVIHDSDVAGKRWGSYCEAQLRDYFEAPSPPLGQRGEYVYSNLGAGLLGYAIEQKAKVPLERLIVDRVCKPLGMESTSFSLEPTCIAHDPDGNPAEDWPQRDSILGGAFGLRSTCKDLMTFAKANLQPERTVLKDALQSALESRADINGLESTALGWKRNKFEVVYTTGATGGFRSALFLHLPTKTAVVVLTNSLVGGVVGGRAAVFDGIAASVLNVAVGAPPLEIDLPSPFADSGSLDDFVGLYRPEEGGGGPSFPIRVKENRLLTIGPGGVEMRLWPKGPDVFFVRSYAAEIRFLRNASGQVTGADLQFEGHQAQLKRFQE